MITVAEVLSHRFHGHLHRFAKQFDFKNHAGECRCFHLIVLNDLCQSVKSVAHEPLFDLQDLELDLAVRGFSFHDLTHLVLHQGFSNGRFV